MKGYLNNLRSGVSEKAVSLGEPPLEGLVEDFVSAEVLRNALSGLVTDLIMAAFLKTVIKTTEDHGFRTTELERVFYKYDRSYKTKIREFTKVGGDVDEFNTRIRDVLRNF